MIDNITTDDFVVSEMCEVRFLLDATFGEQLLSFSSQKV